MAFKKNNQLWRLADPAKVGRPLKWKTPEDLWEDAKGYFKYKDEEPFTSTEVTVSEKGSYSKSIHHKRAYTWQGLFVYLGVPDLKYYKEKDEFSPILTHIGNIMYEQKFEGASAGVFNSNIISRDLGLRDNHDVTTKGEKMGVIELPSNDRDK